MMPDDEHERFDLRPSDPELRDEGWIWISKDPDEEQILWLHGPSQRSVSARRFGTRANHRCTPDIGPYVVHVMRHSELGFPTDGDIMGPYPNLAKAVAAARRVRQSILDERRDVTMPEQRELFGVEA